MDKLNRQLAADVVKIAHIFLPAKNVDIEKWAVIACDQFTQDEDYWRRVEDISRGAPSTLNLIYPEVYLGHGGGAERIERIHETMRSYLGTVYTDSPVLDAPRLAGAFIERKTRHGVRQGLLIAVDLEQYDWQAGSQTLIRATEGTLPERLPPRMDIRRGAALELPHILLMVDDQENMLMSLLEKMLVNAPFAYDTPLMMDGGRVRARFMYRKNDWSLMGNVFDHLSRASINRYKTENPFLFAVGDGNHSLAAAKAVWDEFKQAHAGEYGIENHSARYALAEVVNLYDPAIVFEPIHRIALNTDIDRVIKALGALDSFSAADVDSREALQLMVSDTECPENRCGIVSGDRFVLARYSGSKTATADIDPLLEGFELDYVHGDSEIFRITSAQAAGPSAVGVLLPPFSKNSLFRNIAQNGPLPRKSFSIGESCEKRYYLECRRLFY
jgi:hypothetical protein